MLRIADKVLVAVNRSHPGDGLAGITGTIGQYETLMAITRDGRRAICFIAGTGRLNGMGGRETKRLLRLGSNHVGNPFAVIKTNRNSKPPTGGLPNVFDRDNLNTPLVRGSGYRITAISNIPTSKSNARRIWQRAAMVASGKTKIKKPGIGLNEGSRWTAKICDESRPCRIA